jgi:hypothetical protein
VRMHNCVVPCHWPVAVEASPNLPQDVFALEVESENKREDGLRQEGGVKGGGRQGGMEGGRRGGGGEGEEGVTA